MFTDKEVMDARNKIFEMLNWSRYDLKLLEEESPIDLPMWIHYEGRESGLTDALEVLDQMYFGREEGDYDDS